MPFSFHFTGISMLTRRFSKSFALIVLVFNSQPQLPAGVYAQISMTARAEAGVDPATRQFYRNSSERLGAANRKPI